MRDKVHSRISISHLKALARNHKEVRYVIDAKNRIHAGPAAKYIHSDIERESGDVPYPQICGYIQYKRDRYTHHPLYVATEDDTKYRIGRRPILDKFKEANITRARKALSFEW